MLRCRLAALGLTAALLAGCHQPSPPPTLHPLTGTLTRAGGQPVTGGGLIFIPETGGWGGRVVDASVGPDGTFAARTSHTAGTGTVLQPGAPVGRYTVVYHPPGDGQKVGSEVPLSDPVAVVEGGSAAALVLPERGGPAVAPATPPSGR